MNMKDSYFTFCFAVSVMLTLLGKKDKLSAREFEWAISMMKKSLGSAYVTHDLDFAEQAKMMVTVDANKLECEVENVEDLVNLIHERIVQASDTIENPPEGIRHSQLNEENKLVKLSSKLGSEGDREKCLEYEKSYEPFEMVCPEMSRVSMDFDSGIYPCMTTLSFRYDGQDIKCSIDEDTLEEIRDVLDGYQSGDVKTFNVSIEGVKNKLGKYKEVKLVGLDQA